MRHLVWGVLGLLTQQVFSQVTQPDNNGGIGSFLGWNSGANQLLEVKNEANQAIDWYTDNLFRMHLNESLTYGLLGGFSSVPADGFALITPSYSFKPAQGEYPPVPSLRRVFPVRR